MPLVPPGTRLSVVVAEEQVWSGPCPGDPLDYCERVAPFVTNAPVCGGGTDADATLLRLAEECSAERHPMSVVHFSPFDFDGVSDERLMDALRAIVRLSRSPSLNALAIVGEEAFDLRWVSWSFGELLGRRLSVHGHRALKPGDLAERLWRDRA